MSPPHLFNIGFNIGHSTDPIDRCVALLTQHDIKVLADRRRFPESRKFPHFTLTEGSKVESGELTYPQPDGADQGNHGRVIVPRRSRDGSIRRSSENLFDEVQGRSPPNASPGVG